MYRVEIWYDDDAAFIMDGVAKYTVVGIVKDALDGALTSDQRDPVSVTVSVCARDVPEE